MFVTHRPTEIQGEPRNKHIRPQPALSQHRSPKYTLKEIQPLKQVVLGALDIHMSDSEISSLPLVCMETNSNWIKGLKRKTPSLEAARKKQRNTPISEQRQGLSE